MDTISYEKTFEWNGQSIKLFLLPAPVDKGLIGMITSELFEYNMGLVKDATPDDEKDYSLACLKRAKEVHPIVFMEPFLIEGLRHSEALAETILFHEIGHYINDGLKKNDENQRERVKEATMGGVAAKELAADAFAAKFLSHDRVTAALEELKRQTVEEYSGEEYDPEEVAIVLKEIDARISALRDAI